MKRFIIARQVIQQSPGAKPEFFYGYIIVATAFSIMVAIFGLYYSFGIFFDPVLLEFGWTRATTSGAFSLSMIVYGLLNVAVGGFTDRFGPRMVVTICGVLIGLGYLLMSQISTVWQLYLFYGVIIGAGMGGSFIALLSSVAKWFVKRRGMMTGIVMAGIGIGTLIGPPVASWLIATYGWRLSYVILGSIVLLVVVLAAQFLRRDPTQVGQVAYGADEVEKLRPRLGAGGFSLREAIYTRQFWIVFAMLFCFGFGLYAVLVHIAPHAIELEISAANAASILAAIGVSSILGKVLLGIAVDRIGGRLGFIISFILISAALFWLVPVTEVWRLYLFAAIFGFAYGGCGVSEAPLVAGLFGLRSHGLVLGVINVGFTIGGSLGPLMAGYIFDVTGSYQVAFLISAIIGIVGLILAAVLRPSSAL